MTRAATPAPRAVPEVRAHLLEIAATLQRDGAVLAAAELRDLAETLGEPAPAASSPPSVRDTKVASAEALHEIHNALVGIRGHVHLLLHGPAGHEPRVRNGLEVILRESTRIEKAARLAPAGDPEAVRSS